MYSLFRGLKIERYFSAWLVLGIDLIISIGASLLVIVFYELFIARVIPDIYFTVYWLAGALAASLLMFFGLRIYKSIIRYSTLQEIGKLCVAVLGKEILLGLLLLSLAFARVLPYLSGWVWMLLFDFLLTFGALVLLRIVMIAAYDVLRNRSNSKQSSERLLIYGTSEKSVSQIIRLKHSRHYEIVGFLTYGKAQRGHTLSGYRVFYFESEENLRLLQERYGVDAILFAYYTDAQAEQERLLRYCPKCGLQTLIVPAIDTISEGQIPKPIRKIKIEDLLGRPEIKISMNEIVDNFKDKVVLVTGAAGSIGSELCRQLARFGIRQLVLFDNAETPLHTLRLELEDKCPELSFIPIIGDVRMKARLDFVFRTYRPQVVFHAAAYKHVPLMEENPCEAVLANVIGSRNVADKCIEYGIESMVMISTDKAVNPTNIMGCTKRLAEIYVQSLGLAVAGGKVAGKTKFVTTRFGNVLGSNGSVIPRFEEQITHGGPVTVTHPEITRFFMTIPEACRLVMEAATISEGNQICVFDMGEPVKIADLAKLMIKLSGFRIDKDIKIEYTGLRPGEKLYEEVLASAENTLSTSHDRIRIAKVREYDYDSVRTIADTLETLAREVNIPDMVNLMKETVPEFMPHMQKKKI